MTCVSNIFFCSLPQNALLFLWPRPYPNCVGLTQSVRRLSVVSTTIMGRVLLYSLFLTGQPPFWGAASLSSTPVHVAFFLVSIGTLDVWAASGHSQHFLLIRKTVVFFSSWLAASCARSGWPGPGLCARDARVQSFFCSFSQNALLFLWPRPYPNGVGLTQGVRCLSVVSTDMGTVLLYSLFLIRPATFLGGSKSLRQSRACCLFSCVCWRS